jgi:hypothetical protein
LKNNKFQIEIANFWWKNAYHVFAMRGRGRAARARRAMDFL